MTDQKPPNPPPPAFHPGSAHVGGPIGTRDQGGTDLSSRSSVLLRISHLDARYAGLDSAERDLQRALVQLQGEEQRLLRIHNWNAGGDDAAGVISAPAEPVAHQRSSFLRQRETETAARDALSRLEAALMGIVDSDDDSRGDGGGERTGI